MSLSTKGVKILTRVEAMLELIKSFQKMSTGKDPVSLYNVLVGQLDSNFRKIEKGVPHGKIDLVAGKATVSFPGLSGQALILLTSQVDSGTPGFLRVQSRVEGASFKIVSSSNSDTSTVAWQIIN